MATLRYFDEDWDEIRDLYTCWWTGRKPHRPILAVLAPRETPIPCPPAPPPPDDPRDAWLDYVGSARRFEAHIATQFHGGCAVPYITPSLGPGALNLYLGSRPIFAPQTVWYSPVYSDPATATLSFDPQNEYWQWTLRATDYFLEEGRGKYLTGLPDLIEGLDILSELLGTEELLTYLLDCPQEIHRLLSQLDSIYWEAFDPLYEKVRDDRGGNLFIAFQIWGPGRTLKSQCDFAAMISPAMFEEFVCPYLERQCARADYSVFHLDGPRCIAHLDLLLKVPSLTAVQWTPGYPNPAASDPVWWDVIWEKVFAAGKSALVLGTPLRDVEPFLKRFGWERTFLGVGAPSEAEARRLLRESRHWGR